tara:strand:+ start:230 stop:553 length:324 start_codon:yes stop_codon:yes gene_type:complete
MRKAEIMKHWQSLDAGLPITPAPVPYKHKGSTFDQDGIRITGSPEFIDSVLSTLKGVLGCENGKTRLQLAYSQSVCKESGRKLDSFQCYVQVHDRGPQAQMVNKLFG